MGMAFASALAWADDSIGHGAGLSSTIHVDGSSMVSVVPDQAHLTMSFALRGDDTRALERTVTHQISTLSRALHDYGVMESDINASSIRIQPQYRYDQQRQQQVEQGFLVERSIGLTLRDLKQLAAIIQLATEHQVSSVSPPHLSSSQQEQAYRQALEKAFEQAKQRAQRLASLAGLSLGQARLINASQGYRPPMPVATRAVMAMAEDTSGYEPGELNVTASVTVEFQANP